jgi:adenine-specific DNA-methyltransferase
MEKMEGKTIDIVADNIAKLKALFPEAVTEGKIDFDVLKELLGEYVEDRDERYSFTWNGKSKARMLAQTPSTGTLRPCPEESVNWETTKNIFIEGDNLEVLKLLQKSYHKKIKVICIDPPYNTGHDFVYKDDFKDNINNYKLITGQIDGEGRNISSNPETSGRYHTDWLNMMYPRLKLARNLLKDDGVIFISIDDNEASNLKKICDDIFGEENFVADFVWQRKYGASNNSKGVAPMIDHIFCYSKTTEFVVGRFPRSQEATERYKNPDGDHRGPWKAVDYWNPLSPGERPNLAYTITNPFTGKEIIPEKKAWKYSQEKYFEHATDNRIYWGKDGTNTVPTLKRFLSEVDDGVTPTNFWDWKFASHTDAAKKILNDLGVIGFSTPKPPLLIERMLQVSSTNEDDLILDFFAGSATTVHAVMQFNPL